MYRSGGFGCQLGGSAYDLKAVREGRQCERVSALTLPRTDGEAEAPPQLSLPARVGDLRTTLTLSEELHIFLSPRTKEDAGLQRYCGDRGI
ncbi:hypothetical protein AOLI_G00115130 [Acnodon oligacanthus]